MFLSFLMIMFFFRGVHFVKISSSGGKSKFGVSSTPTLVFFKNKAPHFYEGDCKRERGREREKMREKERGIEEEKKQS